MFLGKVGGSLDLTDLFRLSVCVLAFVVCYTYTRIDRDYILMKMQRQVTNYVVLDGISGIGGLGHF